MNTVNCAFNLSTSSVLLMLFIIFFQVKGGSGRNGGAGGRLAISYIYNFFAGKYYSNGGVGNGGEYGAAGTVYTKDNSSADGEKMLRIYNRKGAGVRIILHRFR